VITLTLAAAAFMGVFAMFTVITDEINKLFETFDYEIMIIPSEPQDFNEIKDLVLEVEGTDDVYPGVAFGIRIIDLDGTVLSVGMEGGEELDAFGYDPATPTMELTYDEGSGWRDDPEREGIVVTSAAAKDLGKEVGDVVVVSAGGRSQEYELIGVAAYPFPVAFLKWQDLAELAGFVTPDGAPLPVVFFTLLENTDPASTEVDDKISDISERMLDAGVTASFQNQIALQEDIADQMLVFNMIFQITSGVMAAVGAIGLLTTLSMAVFERQKEIGVMRSIGAGSGTIVSQFLVEGILIGLLAWALAVPLSYLLAVALLDGLGFADFIEFSYPLWVLGLGLVGMIIISSVASLWPSLTAARRTVSDILRYQ
jgi:putative ABC transport system permease protein